MGSKYKVALHSKEVHKVSRSSAEKGERKIPKPSQSNRKRHVHAHRAIFNSNRTNRGGHASSAAASTTKPSAATTTTASTTPQTSITAKTEPAEIPDKHHMDSTKNGACPPATRPAGTPAVGLAGGNSDPRRKSRPRPSLATSKGAGFESTAVTPSTPNQPPLRPDRAAGNGTLPTDRRGSDYHRQHAWSAGHPPQPSPSQRQATYRAARDPPQ